MHFAAATYQRSTKRHLDRPLSMTPVEPEDSSVPFTVVAMSLPVTITSSDIRTRFSNAIFVEVYSRTIIAIAITRGKCLTRRPISQSSITDNQARNFVTSRSCSSERSNHFPMGYVCTCVHYRISSRAYANECTSCAKRKVRSPGAIGTTRIYSLRERRG